MTNKIELSEVFADVETSYISVSRDSFDGLVEIRLTIEDVRKLYNMALDMELDRVRCITEAPVRTSCTPMYPEDGRRAYYYDTPELYIDVEEDFHIKGKFSIFVKDRITGNEEFLDQVETGDINE
jgi:hypothetical protein